MYHLLNALHELNNLNEEYLVEDIASVKKYYPTIDDDKFMQLISLDPTYIDGKDKLGNYGKWILNLYKQNKLKDEDFYKVTDYLTAFDKKKKNFANKDIGQFKSLPDLYTALENIDTSHLTDRQIERRRRSAYDEAEKVFEDGEWVIYTPKTYNASCTLGKGTQWCTAYSENDRYYNSYTEQGPLYIVINKGDDRIKYQFHKESHSFMNAKDDPVSVLKTFAKDDKVLEFFNNIVGDNAYQYEEEEIQIKKSLETGEIDVAPYYETAIDTYLGMQRDATPELVATVLVSGHDNAIYDYCLSAVEGSGLYSSFIDNYVNSKYNQENLKRLADYLRLDYTLLAEILTNNYDGDEDYDNIVETAQNIFYDYYIDTLYQTIYDTVLIALNGNIDKSLIAENRDPDDKYFDTITLSDYYINNPYRNLITWEISDEDEYDGVEDISYNPLINRFLYDLLNDIYIDEPSYGWEGDYIDDDDFTQQMIENLD